MLNKVCFHMYDSLGRGKNSHIEKDRIGRTLRGTKILFYGCGLKFFSPLRF